MNTKRILSGVQPSGKLHIGNYLGAIKQFVELQDEYEAYYCVVDQHAITVPQNPQELRDNTLTIAMWYIAAGIDPKKSVIFVQSHVPAHTELGWILNTMTPLGELERMTQFKDKTEKGGEIYAGLFNYPTLMAADILLYQAIAVPVGEDQVQHIEFTRSLAKRFNNRFGDIFIVPKALLQKTSSRVMALDDPTKKMSKSASSEQSYIALTDTPDQIRKKIKSSTTDSKKEIHHDPKIKPGISNLLDIAAGFSKRSIKELEKEFVNSSYAQFKEAVAEYIISGLTPLQERYKELQENKNEVLNILHQGGEKARIIANQTLKNAKDKIGFLQ